MTRQECSQIFTIIQMNYRNFYKTITQTEIIVVINTFMRHFANIPSEVMMKALDEYMMIEPSYPPSIGHFNKILHGMITEPVGNAEQSFNDVMELISRFGSDSYGYDKAFENHEFNDVEKQLLSKSYWNDLGQSESAKTTLKAQYRDNYNSTTERLTTKGRKMLTRLESKDVLDKIGQRMANKQIGG